MNNFISKSTYVFTAVIFTIIFISSFIFDSNVYYSQNKLISLLVCLVLMALWLLILWVINKFVKEKVSVKVHCAILIGYLVIVTLLQQFVVNYLMVDPGWDYSVVFENAKYYILNGQRWGAVYPEYFQLFPNNILIFYILTKVVVLSNIFNVGYVGMAVLLNRILIDFALVMLYLVLNKKYNFKIALFGIIISLFFIPLFLYTPIFYSDTFSLFVGITLIYVYLHVDKETIISKKNIILFILFGLLLFYGKEIKITSVFVLIAIFIDYIFSVKGYKKFINVGITLLVFLVCSLLFKVLVVNNEKYNFSIDQFGAYPHTHWIMMGVEDIDKDNSSRNSYGGYNEEDYFFTKSFTNGKEASKYNIEEYKRRVSKMGVGGYSTYLLKKGVNAWSDGLYFSDVALQIKSKNADGEVYKFLFKNESTKFIIVYFAQGVQFAFILSLIAISIMRFKDKKIHYILLSILALFFFLLLWENRSRYLFNYIPLFIMIICELYYMGINIILKKKKGSRK